MEEIMNTITPAIRDLPITIVSRGPWTAAMDPSYWSPCEIGTVNLGLRNAVPRHAARGASLPKLTAAEYEKSPANLWTCNRIPGLRRAIAARSIQGICAASIHNPHRASSSAKFACRRRGRVHVRRRPCLRPFAGLPCHGPRSCSAKPDGPRQAIPPGTSPADDESDREAGPRTSTAWRRWAREEYTSDKRRRKGCWRSRSRRSGSFLWRLQRLAARAREIEARNSSASNRFQTTRFRQLSGALMAAQFASEETYVSPPQPQPVTGSRAIPEVSVQ